jgi:hypothetical protein
LGFGKLASGGYAGASRRACGAVVASASRRGQRLVGGGTEAGAVYNKPLIVSRDLKTNAIFSSLLFCGFDEKSHG